MDERGLGIIFHSGSYDRVYHGLAIALTASALGREVKMFFTYWALEHLRRERTESLYLDNEAEDHRGIVESNLEKGHMRELSELLGDAKELRVKLYVCVSSMAFLNIARDELMDEVDESTGIATFLKETKGYQILFI